MRAGAVVIAAVALLLSFAGCRTAYTDGLYHLDTYCPSYEKMPYSADSLLYFRDVVNDMYKFETEDTK
jgi:hypothetical protein